MEEKTQSVNISQCPICGSALATNIDDHGRMSIRCTSGKRCINLSGKDHARLFDILRNADWRAIAEEVKSCPQCGGDEVEIWLEDTKFWIHCTHPNCWARGVARGATLAEVRAQWKEIVGDEPNVAAVKGISMNGEKMEVKKEKTPNVIIAPCPKCGKVPAIHDISDTGDDQHMISCCGVSKVLDGCLATIESWNDYCAEHQPKTPAERSQDKISEVVETLRKILISKNQNYGNSAFRPPVLLPDLPAEKAIFVRMSDKVARLAQLTSGEKDRVGESIEDTLYDLAGYCVLAIIAMREGDAVR